MLVPVVAQASSAHPIRLLRNKHKHKVRRVEACRPVCEHVCPPPLSVVVCRVLGGHAGARYVRLTALLLGVSAKKAGVVLAVDSLFWLRGDAVWARDKCGVLGGIR